MNEMQSFIRKKSSSTSRVCHLWSFLKKEKGKKTVPITCSKWQSTIFNDSLRFYFYWCCLKVNHSNHCFF